MATLTKVVKVFRNGGSQAIRLPKEFAVDSKEVVMRKDFGVISILPRRKGNLLNLLREIGPMDTLLAAHALSIGATVVTGNMREFARVPARRFMECPLGAMQPRRSVAQ